MSIPSNDHDLLIVLNTKMDQLLTNDTDKERRLRAVEKKIWWLGGVSAILGCGASYGVYVLQAAGKG